MSHTNTAIGAYSALPMRFGNFLITAPAVVLPNNSYNILISTQFSLEFQEVINYKEIYLLLLSYKVPIFINEVNKKFKQVC